MIILKFLLSTVFMILGFTAVGASLMLWSIEGFSIWMLWGILGGGFVGWLCLRYIRMENGNWIEEAKERTKKEEEHWGYWDYTEEEWAKMIGSRKEGLFWVSNVVLGMVMGLGLLLGLVGGQILMGLGIGALLGIPFWLLLFWLQWSDVSAMAKSKERRVYFHPHNLLLGNSLFTLTFYGRNLVGVAYLPEENILRFAVEARANNNRAIHVRDVIVKDAALAEALVQRYRELYQLNEASN